MQKSLETSLVRIHSATGGIIGAGFLVGERHILTCAHVVASALDLADDTTEKPQTLVSLDLPRVAPGRVLSARIVLWRPPLPDGGDDIAVLELESDPPQGAQTAPLAHVEDLWEHAFRAFGFPKGYDTGVWATGRLLGRQVTNWVQIEDVKETGFSVEPGFSGTPVWDTQVQAVVGMVVAAEQRSALKTAFAIPLDILAKSWPTLAACVHPFVFLCYARADSAAVTRLKADLQNQGIQVWIDQEQLQPGTLDWEEALRAAVRAARAVLLIASPNARGSRFIRDELRIAEMYQRPIYPLWLAGDHWIDAVPLGWGNTQYIDARADRYEAAISELVEHLSMDDSTPAQTTEYEVEPRNPYKGLRAFRPDDARDFFGRDTLINKLATTLQETLAAEEKHNQATRLLAIVGPSGSGKSSVVMAGLLPRLRAGLLPDSERWVYLDPIVPGTRPIEALTLALSACLPDKSLKVIREDLEDDGARGLHLLATRITKQPDTKVVLLIDQFEELFIQVSSENERRHFIDLLVTATTESQGTVIVLLTLRANFYDRPLAYPTLSQLIQIHQTLVLPLTLQDLREVIEKPATLPDVTLTFQGDLVGDLLFEVQGQVGALPLLQFTLDQLFQQRNGHQLTLSAYRNLGGVKGALTRQAEETYNTLPSDEQRKLARALFMRLIDPGSSEQDTTRRRAALSEFALADATQTQLLQEVADAFITARLLTTNSLIGTTTIEVSHEALIREWPRLAGWLREARDDIHLQQTISEDAARWVQRNKSADHLYRGSQLKEAQAWAARSIPSSSEVTFLSAGLRANTIQHLRYMVSVTMIVLLLLSTTGLVAWLLTRPNPTRISTLADTNDPGSLRNAINQAPNKSIITFDPSLHGTILLLSDLSIAKELTIRGPGTPILAISGGKNAYKIHVVQGSTITISDLTFKGSKATSPRVITNGIIFNDGGTLTLNNSVVSDNTTSYGGILNEVGTLMLNNSIVSDNTAYGDGGGISNNGGTLVLNNSIISDNTAHSNGGGISNNSGTLVLNNNIVSDNTTYGDGGGISNNGGTFILSNSTISANIANGQGGGILINSPIKSSDVITQADLTFNTIYDNTAHGGGDIAIDDIDSGVQVSKVKIKNSIVAGDPTHPESDIMGMLTSYGYNLFQDKAGAIFDPTTHTQHSTDKILSANDLRTLFTNPVKLQNNGGPTRTLALAPNSPAIDQIPLAACHITIPVNIKNNAGTPIAQKPIATNHDQRGVERPNGKTQSCDIGAYEYTGTST